MCMVVRVELLCNICVISVVEMSGRPRSTRIRERNLEKIKINSVIHLNQPENKL